MSEHAIDYRKWESTYTVESIAIADRLAEMRCDILQGYVFDRPLPVEEFELNYRV